MINENLSCSVNVFANFASMFATRLFAFRFIISNSIPDLKLTNVGRLFRRVCWRLNEDTSNLSIIFRNVVIRFNALDEMIVGLNLVIRQIFLFCCMRVWESSLCLSTCLTLLKL